MNIIVKTLPLITQNIRFAMDSRFIGGFNETGLDKTRRII
jgi:hypothetical protein